MLCIKLILYILGFKFKKKVYIILGYFVYKVVCLKNYFILSDFDFVLIY